MNAFTMTDYTLMKENRGQLLLPETCGMLHTIFTQTFQENNIIILTLAKFLC